jgi:hypothetical protein
VVFFAGGTVGRFQVVGRIACRLDYPYGLC